MKRGISSCDFESEPSAEHQRHGTVLVGDDDHLYSGVYSLGLILCAEQALALDLLYPTGLLLLF